MYLTRVQAQDEKLICYLAEQAISEPISTIRPLSEGLTSHNFEINKHIIFKVPGQTTPIKQWLKQSQFAPILQKHLSCQVPQPKITTVFLNSTSNEALLSSHYEKISGRTIRYSKTFNKQDKKTKIYIFEQLADIVQQLHSISPNSLPVQLPTTETFLMNMFSQIVGKLSSKQEKIIHQLVHFPWIGFRKDLKFDSLCHCDLRCANICLDDRKKITGILDFDSLSLGQPFFEFRPFLYGSHNHEADTKLFYHIYSQRTGYQTDPENLKKMRRLFWGLCALGVLYKLHNSKNKKNTRAFLKKISKTLGRL